MICTCFQCIVRATVIGFDEALFSHYPTELQSSEAVLTDAIRLQVWSCGYAILLEGLDQNLLSS